MRNIRLNDGTVYAVDRCGAASAHLLINITSGENIAALAVAFSDETKTKVIEHFYDDSPNDHVTFEGYTVLSAVSVSDTGISINLAKKE